jgi:hypothetical protein
MRKRRSFTGPMEQWLRGAGIDPVEPCRGISAIRALQRKLREDFGVSYVYTQHGNLYSLFDKALLVHRDDARNYLWGREVTLEVQTGHENQPADSSTSA